MINAWRDYTMNSIAKATESGAYEAKSGKNQLKFARDNILQVMYGVQKLKSIPITILHHDSLMFTVEGINTQEIADFVVHIANCDSFNVIFVPNRRHSDRYKIVTRFESGDISTKKVYGKVA